MYSYSVVTKGLITAGVKYCCDYMLNFSSGANLKFP